MRATTQLYLINGRPMLVPDADVQESYEDLDSADAGRDESGVMHRFVVRSRVRSWSFTYSLLTGEELAYLRGLFAGKATFRFAFDGGETTAYCSGEEVHLYDRKRGVYKGLKFDVIEC